MATYIIYICKLYICIHTITSSYEAVHFWKSMFQFRRVPSCFSQKYIDNNLFYEVACFCLRVQGRARMLEAEWRRNI